jgi:hypothetical protein
LVIASTCDHYTRVSTGGSKLPEDAPVYGLLFGTNTDGYLSVCDSVDCNYTCTPDGVEVIPGEFESKTKLWTAVFTTYSLIGWYSFGAALSPEHAKFHELVAAHTPDPVFLFINPSAASDSDELPLNVYRYESDSRQLCDTPFRIETSEVEKVALDHITKSTPVPGQSAMEVQNQSSLTSLRILDGKVGVVVAALQAMRDGTLPVDHALLRRAAKICQALPPIDSSTFDKDFADEMTNSLVISYLSAATKTVGQLNEVTDLYSSSYGEKGYSK